MKITSPAFAHKQPVPPQYTCMGANISPPFEFLDVASETKSLTITIEDLDSQNHWIHWLVYNIPGDTAYFEEGKIPEGAIEGVCNGGTHGYEGPCPKSFAGVHRYCFKLYAVDKILDVPYEADCKEVLRQMEGHIIEIAELLGLAEGDQVSVANHETATGSSK